MDLNRILDVLYARRKVLQQSIARLEQVLQLGASADPPIKRGGRKSMSADERRDVSARMKKYWASRREQAEERSR